MSKHFLTKKEQETILAAYSKNYEKELTKYGPYTFGTEYAYRISICPEIDHKGKETGRILVNHYSYSYGSLKKIPEFIDVWEREEERLIFKTRNIPGKDLISAEEKIKVLEEEINLLNNTDKTPIGKLQTKKLHDYAIKMTKTAEYYRTNYNDIAKRIHSYKEESDTYFRESPAYFELIKERDDALIELEKEKEKNNKLEEKLRNATEKLLNVSKQLEEQAVLSKPMMHNARGAGRKKTEERKQQIKCVAKLLDKGMSVKEICEELNIGQSTCYKYVKEIKEQIN